MATPDGIDAVIEARAPALAGRLPPADRARYLAHARRLVERVSWEPATDLVLGDDELSDVVTTIAAHAALLAAGFEPATDPFRDVTSVVIRARTFVTRDVRPGPVAGVVTDAPRHLAGQAGLGRGPVVIDWRAAQRDIALPEGGTNVIYHEFAHKLDQLDGVYDGRPPLGSDLARAEWDQTFGTNYRRLVRRGRDPLIRAYAATNPVEYFAVTSELFFTVPDALAEHHPRVYARLAGFYRQDPAAVAP